MSKARLLGIVFAGAVFVGINEVNPRISLHWISAFAGMTNKLVLLS